MTVGPDWLVARDEGLLLRAYVQPRASRSAWGEPFADGRETRLRLKIAAPPVDGEANEEALRFLKKTLRSAGVRDVRLLRGETSRQKDFLLVGADPDAIRRAVASRPGAKEG